MSRTIAVRVEPASPDNPGLRLISFAGVGLGGVIAIRVVDRPDPDGSLGRPDIHVEVVKGDLGVYTVVAEDGAYRRVPAPLVGREAAPAVADELAPLDQRWAAAMAQWRALRPPTGGDR